MPTLNFSKNVILVFFVLQKVLECSIIGACPSDDWTDYNGRCYLVDPAIRSWDSAKAYCDSFSDASGTGSLAAVTSVEVEEFLKTIMSPPYDYYMGLRLMGSVGTSCHAPRCFYWQSGDEVGYTHWSAGQPDMTRGDEYCGHLRDRVVEWNDWLCNKEQYQTICEWRANEHTCPSNAWRGLDGNCYLFVHPTDVDPAGVSADEARRACREFTPGEGISSLTSITSPGIRNFFLANTEATGASYWIGGRLKGEFCPGPECYYWENGDAFTSYQNWDDGQPNNAEGDETCIDFRAGTNGVWHDFSCDAKIENYGYICEWRPIIDEPCLIAQRLGEEFQRSINYTIAVGGAGEIDDHKLFSGWYRFDSPHGNDMPSFSVPSFHCGVQSPVYLQDDLPSLEDGVVDRVGYTTLVNAADTSSSFTYNLKIKQCQSGDTNFYVYYLVETEESVNSAYCSGTEVPCPDGETSPNYGYTPGCTDGAFPELSNDPVLTPSFGPAECPEACSACSEGMCTKDCPRGTARYVVLQCDIDHDETDIEYEVTWYYRDFIIKVENVTDGELPAEMTEMDFYRDRDLPLPGTARCQMRPRYLNSTLYGRPRETEFWLGMEVQETFLTVQEGQQTQIFIRPTVPLLGRACDETPLVIEVREPYSGEDKSRCESSRSQTRTEVDIEYSYCGIAMPPTFDVLNSTWFAINVSGASESEYDGDIIRQLDLQTILVFQSHPLWQAYKLPNIQIKVVDEDEDIAGMVCYGHYDPHMGTFDGKKYEMQMEGEFIMYRHTDLPIEVQVYFQNVNNAFSKTCGAAIRSGGDLFIVDYCRMDSTPRIELYECHDMRLKITEEGTTYTVYLPTGTSIRLDLDSHPNIDIWPSIYDYGPESITTLGLCGVMNKNQDDDFTMRDGTVTTSEMDFANSWRVLEEESLFSGRLGDFVPYTDQYYCACEKPEGCDDPCDEARVVCGMSGACIPGEDAGNWTEKCLGQKPDGYNDKYTIFDDNVEEEVNMFTFNSNWTAPNPEWRNGFNETYAKDICENLILHTEQLKNCYDIPNINFGDAITMCVQDIHILGEASTINSHIFDLVAVCKEQVSRNMSLYTFDNSTGSVLPPLDILADLCPNNCSNHGECFEGECICTEGRIGSDCSWDSNKVPDLRPVQFNGTCDLRGRPCGATPVHGEYFINTAASRCRVTTTLLRKDGSRTSYDAVDTVLAYMHPYKVMCPFPVIDFDPDDDMFTIGYEVAVTNNGKDFSSHVPLAVYDSLCMHCTSTLHCWKEDGKCLFHGRCYDDMEPKDPTKTCVVCDGDTDSFVLSPDSCFIDDQCYSRSQTSPHNACQVCDPSQDLTNWSEGDSDGCKLASGIIAVIAVCAVIALALPIVIGSIHAVKRSARIADSGEREGYSNESIEMPAIPPPDYYNLDDAVHIPERYYE